MYHAIFSKVSLYRRGGKLFSKFTVKSASYIERKTLVKGEWVTTRVPMQAKSFPYPNQIDGLQEKHAYVVVQYMMELGIDRTFATGKVRRMVCADAGDIGFVWTLEPVAGFDRSAHWAELAEPTKPGISANSLPSE